MKRTVIAILLVTLLILGTLGCAGGASFLPHSRTVCPQCGGTGQYYQPNVFFDGTMWQGAYIACPSCGGSGCLN